MGHLAYKGKKMSQRIIHNFIWAPIFFIGLVSIALGFIWFIHPEPWTLDQPPNEVLIQTTFKNLFSKEINAFLPEYLLVLYKFFGWWMIIIGLLIIIFVLTTRLSTKNSRYSIYLVLFVNLIGLYYMIFNFLPTSPFKPMLYFLTFLLISSICFSIIFED